MFKENNEEITETTKKVAEDAKPNVARCHRRYQKDQGDHVGTPVMADDLNGDDLLTYTLSGDRHGFVQNHKRRWTAPWRSKVVRSRWRPAPSWTTKTRTPTW